MLGEVTGMSQVYLLKYISMHVRGAILHEQTFASVLSSCPVNAGLIYNITIVTMIGPNKIIKHKKKHFESEMVF